MKTCSCYFCEALIADRDAMPADPYNDNDGGSICADCLEIREKRRKIIARIVVDLKDLLRF